MRDAADEWRNLDSDKRKAYQNQANEESHSNQASKRQLGDLGFQNFTKKLCLEVTNMVRWYENSQV